MYDCILNSDLCQLSDMSNSDGGILFLEHPTRMYFPTTSARKLATTPGLPNVPSEHAVALTPSPRKFLFCTLTRSAVAVWSGRVS